MARDTSPIVKQSRREGYALAPKAHKVMAKKTGIPGEHSDMRVRGGSLYLTQLREKQKVRRLYGLLEKQFAKLMKLKKKEDQSVGASVLLRRGNKIITGGRGREGPGRREGEKKRVSCGERVWRQSQRRQGLQLSHMTCT